MDTKTIKDERGHMIGKIITEWDGTQKVFDDCNHYMGKADKTGTWDAQNRKISSSQAPMLLLR